jgi:hypothetical protein
MTAKTSLQSTELLSFKVCSIEDEGLMYCSVDKPSIVPKPSTSNDGSFVDQWPLRQSGRASFTLVTLSSPKQILACWEHKCSRQLVTMSRHWLAFGSAVCWRRPPVHYPLLSLPRMWSRIVSHANLQAITNHSIYATIVRPVASPIAVQI